MDIRQNVSLAPYTTFGIGGPADFFVEVISSEDIIEAVQWAKDPSMHSGQEIPFFLLGTGANILIGDKGYRGLVIRNKANKIRVKGKAKSVKKKEEEIILHAPPLTLSPENKVFITAESGTTIEELIKFTLEKGLSGFEHFAGIPSSVGGALWQNLHFLSPDRSKTVFIGDIVTEAQVLQISNIKYLISTVGRDYFQFSYDYSILHDTHDIVLSATFALTPENPNVIKQRINANVLWRKEKHPTNAVKTSAGSIFKKIEGYGAGRLIEQVGLKGKIIGGAKVSDQHANFILNENDATAKDVRDLIELIQETVKKELGLTMQTEISFIGEF